VPAPQAPSTPAELPPPLQHYVTVPFDAVAGRVIAGGGGRNLAIELWDRGEIAVFDTRRRAVLYRVPAPRGIKFAAALNMLYVAPPRTAKLQRFDLDSGRPEEPLPLPARDHARALAVGSAATGPLLLGVGANSEMATVLFLDPHTAAPLPLTWRRPATGADVFSLPDSARVTASADGRTFAVCTPGATRLDVLILGAGECRHYRDTTLKPVHAYPDASGGYVCTGEGLLRVTPAGLQPDPEAAGQIAPAVDGDYYLRWPVRHWQLRPGRPDPDAPPVVLGGAVEPVLSVHAYGVGTALGTVAPGRGPEPAALLRPVVTTQTRIGPGTRTGVRLPSVDLGLYPVLSARLLAYVPPTHDRLDLYPFDLASLRPPEKKPDPITAQPTGASG
jgi:hypothetical protein